MNYKRFSYQFFHFNSLHWESFWNSQTMKLEDLAELFTNDLFPKRSLKISFPRSLSEAIPIFEKVIALEKTHSIQCIGEFDTSYPKQIEQYISPENRPPFLFVRGNAELKECDLISLVGTRNPSLFGVEQAKNFSSFLTALNIRVVSGLAKGIDTICHEENISKGTVAVLGGEILEVYPSENQKLADAIAHTGTLISPFPLHQVPLPQNFPLRNRIIAALAAGTIVIEGSQKSGASITGNFSLEMGKTVVALSQDFRTEFGRGAINLQQNGAVLVKSEEEALHAIFARLGGCLIETPKKTAHKTFSFIEFQKTHRTSIPETLALLEQALLLGHIKRTGFDRYELQLRT